METLNPHQHPALAPSKSIRELNESKNKLEQELSSIRQQIAKLGQEQPSGQSQLLFKSKIAQVEENNSPLPQVILRSLRSLDPLRRKWNLGAGIPPADTNHNHQLQEQAARSISRITKNQDQLRIYGLLPSGEPWQSRILIRDIIQNGSISIGRDPKHAQIIIPDEGVSRAHIILSLGGDGICLCDNGSTNGTFIENRRITPHDEQIPLYDGMTIKIGETTLRAELI